MRPPAQLRNPDWRNWLDRAPSPIIEPAGDAFCDAALTWLRRVPELAELTTGERDAIRFWLLFYEVQLLDAKAGEYETGMVRLSEASVALLGSAMGATVLVNLGIVSIATAGAAVGVGLALISLGFAGAAVKRAATKRRRDNRITDIQRHLNRIAQQL